MRIPGLTLRQLRGQLARTVNTGAVTQEHSCSQKDASEDPKQSHRGQRQVHRQGQDVSQDRQLAALRPRSRPIFPGFCSLAARADSGEDYSQYPNTLSYLRDIDNGLFHPAINTIVQPSDVRLREPVN